MALSEQGRGQPVLFLIPPLLPSVSPSFGFPVLAMCTLWNANNLWISLANPSVATSPTTHPCMRQLFPSQQGGWPTCAPDLYEPVGALFEQLGPGLYQPQLLETFSIKQPPWGFHFSFSAGTKEMEVGKCQQFLWVACLVIGRALHSRVSEHQGKNNELICIGVSAKTALLWISRRDWRVPFTGKFRKKGFGLWHTVETWVS